MAAFNPGNPQWFDFTPCCTIHKETNNKQEKIPTARSVVRLTLTVTKR